MSELKNWYLCEKKLMIIIKISDYTISLFSLVKLFAKI